MPRVTEESKDTSDVTGAGAGADLPRHSERMDNFGNSVRKAFRWTTFAKKNLAFGFDKLSSQDVPTMAQQLSGLSISFEKIQGWKLPKLIFDDVSNGLCDVTVHLSLSLLHLKSLTFFGTTWVGSPLPLNEHDELKGTLDVEYPDIVYLLTRIIDPTCVGIVEIIATQISKETKLATSQYGYACFLCLSSPLLKSITLQICIGVAGLCWHSSILTHSKV